MTSLRTLDGRYFVLTATLGGFLSKRRCLAALLGFVLVATAACGGDSAPEAQVMPPGPVDAGPGETVRGEGVSITLFEVGAARSFDRREQASDGKVFIAARLSITTTGTVVPAQGPDDLVLELPDGSVGKPWLVTPEAACAISDRRRGRNWPVGAVGKCRRARAPQP